jgi:hypothetical protein
MSINYKTSGSYSGYTGDSNSIDIPNTYLLYVGDLMIAQIAYYNPTNIITVTTPDGWTLIRSDSFSNYSTSNLYWKIADAEDITDSFTFIFSDSGINTVSSISIFNGFDANNPIGNNNGQGNDRDYIVTSAEITPDYSNSMILLFGCGYGGDGTNVIYSDYTIENSSPVFVEAYSCSETNNSDEFSVGMAYGLRTETIETGNGTANVNQFIYSVGQMVAINDSGV